MYALDFSKAFDTIRHASLLNRVNYFRFPDSIYNWLCNFLTGRSHSTRWLGSVSESLTFSAGVVQGSAIGLAAYVLCASGLQSKFSGNKLSKYADDTYLIVPASNVSTVTEEMKNITIWSESNNLKLNRNKCKEMIFTSPYRSLHFTLPAPGLTPGIERVDSLVILGINVSNNLNFKRQFDDLAVKCNQSMFALRTLKRAGLSDEAVWGVCRATLVAKMLYGSPAWWGFVNKSNTDHLEGILRRATKWGLYPPSAPTMETMVQQSDSLLFRKVLCNNSHVLRGLLPPVKNVPYSLRPRIHDRVLPIKTCTLAKNFIYRMLYSS